MKTTKNILIILSVFSFGLTNLAFSCESTDIEETIQSRYTPDYDNGDTIFINVKIAIDEKGWNTKTPTYFKNELIRQWQQINDRFNGSDKKKELKRVYVFKPDVDDIIVYKGCSYWGEDGADTKVISQMDTTLFKLVVIYDFFYEGEEKGEYGGGCGNNNGIGTILVINGSEGMKNQYNDHFNVYTYRAITHELGHFRGMTDLYANIIEAENNPITHEKLMPPHCLMNDFCYTPDDESYWSDYAIRVINKAGNQKITDMIHTMMYNDFAQELSFVITQNGNPVSAEIKLYPATYSPKKWSNVLSDVPLHSYSAPVGKYKIEDLRKLFFDPQGGGFGRYQVFLVEIVVGNEKKYEWLTDYMMHDCGLTGKKTYEIKIDF